MLETQQRIGQPMGQVGTDHRFQGNLQSQGGTREEHREGMVARTIEEQTAKLPSDTFLWLALGTLGCSCYLQMCGKQHESLFVGQWAAPFLLFGIYNKLVKVAGSDQATA